MQCVISYEYFYNEKNIYAPSRVSVFPFQHFAEQVTLIETQTENPRTLRNLNLLLDSHILVSWIESLYYPVLGKHEDG